MDTSKLETKVLLYLFVGYLMWLYYDKDSCEHGGRRRKWIRGMKLFGHVRDYFPVQLMKKIELPPDENYLFAVFPHGIISLSAFITFGTDALKFEETFKGIKPHLCTLKINFRVPVLRELALACGAVAASRKSLNWILGNPKKGNCAILIVGGAAESLYTETGTYKLCLKNRKGFCRVALQNGSPLVPVFSFGEIEILKQVLPAKHPWLAAFQIWFKKLTGIAPVIFFGKGIFGDYVGIMPRQCPMTVVVGKPIPVKKMENPTEEQVENLHKQFIDAIIELFNSEKHKYLEEPDTDLIIA
ncbi:hypothetical protein RUM44_010411 [Polyplax serrata]|uniref:Acyltransferase n=1 Tax=Polyplax serrata TaxID=468196 RepID=A0ABR1AVE4_POLSC